MSAKLRTRLIGEIGLAAASVVMASLTAARPDWIEWMVGVDLDQHSGAVEGAIVVTLVGIGVASSVLARVHWRRLRASQSNRMNAA